MTTYILKNLNQFYLNLIVLGNKIDSYNWVHIYRHTQKEKAWLTF